MFHFAVFSGEERRKPYILAAFTIHSLIESTNVCGRSTRTIHPSPARCITKSYVGATKYSGV